MRRKLRHLGTMGQNRFLYRPQEKKVLISQIHEHLTLPCRIHQNRCKSSRLHLKGTDETTPITRASPTRVIPQRSSPPLSRIALLSTATRLPPPPPPRSARPRRSRHRRLRAAARAGPRPAGTPGPARRATRRAPRGAPCSPRRRPSSPSTTAPTTGARRGPGPGSLAPAPSATPLLALGREGTHASGSGDSSSPGTLASESLDARVRVRA